MAPQAGFTSVGGYSDYAKRNGLLILSRGCRSDRQRGGAWRGRDGTSACPEIARQICEGKYQRRVL